jgi:hypothetical protein
MSDEVTFNGGNKWRCSACGSLNSPEHDNVCWKCLDRALIEDEQKLRDLGAYDYPSITDKN